MVRTLFLWGALAATLFLSLAVADAAAPAKKSYFQAWWESRATGKPLLVFFHAKWCATCPAMEANLSKTDCSGCCCCSLDYDEQKELCEQMSRTHKLPELQVYWLPKDKEEWQVKWLNEGTPKQLQAWLAQPLAETQ